MLISYWRSIFGRKPKIQFKLGYSGSTFLLNNSKKRLDLTRSTFRQKIEAMSATATAATATAATATAAMLASNLAAESMAKTAMGMAEGQPPEKGMARSLHPGLSSGPSGPGNLVRTPRAGCRAGPRGRRDRWLGWQSWWGHRRC